MSCTRKQVIVNTPCSLKTATVQTFLRIDWNKLVAEIHRLSGKLFSYFIVLFIILFVCRCSEPIALKQLEALYIGRTYHAWKEPAVRTTASVVLLYQTTMWGKGGLGVGEAAWPSG